MRKIILREDSNKYQDECSGRELTHDDFKCQEETGRLYDGVPVKDTFVDDFNRALVRL